MKNKGFTLMELMAAIIILGVISLIAVPLVERVLSGIGEDSYKTQIKNIRAGARQWAADDLSRLPSTNSNTTITLSILQQAGFVKNNLYNPETQELISPDMEIIIEEKNGTYIYYVDSETDVVLNPLSPRISIVGNSLIYIEQGNTYVELGVIVKDGNGDVISSPNLTTRIKNSDGDIISSIPSITGTYNITYTVTLNGFVSKTTRTVIVEDTTPPILNVPAASSIARSTTTFNFMTGVSASDDSAVFVTISTNLTLGIPGKYIVTYTATDAAGNQTVKDREITILF